MIDILEVFQVYFALTRPYIGGVLCLMGAILATVGTIGVIRFPDFYTRLHAAGVTDTLAMTFLLVGMAFLPESSWPVAFKLLCIWLFLILTCPTACHAIAHAAHVAKLEPVNGKIGASQEGDQEE